MATYPYTSPSISKWNHPFWATEFQILILQWARRLCTEPNSAVSWRCTQVQLHDTAVSILYAGPVVNGGLPITPQPYKQALLHFITCGLARSRICEAHLGLSSAVSSWVRIDFRSYHYGRMIQPLFPLREHQKSILCRCMTVHENDDRWRCV